MGVGSVKMSFSDREPHCTQREACRCPGTAVCCLRLQAGVARRAGVRSPHASHAADAIGRWILQVVGVCGVEVGSPRACLLRQPMQLADLPAQQSYRPSTALQVGAGVSRRTRVCTLCSFAVQGTSVLDSRTLLVCESSTQAACSHPHPSRPARLTVAANRAPAHVAIPHRQLRPAAVARDKRHARRPHASWETGGCKQQVGLADRRVGRLAGWAR